MRLNWIDALFKKEDDGLYLLSNHLYQGEDSEGKIILAPAYRGKLDDCLMEDRGKQMNNTEGISLDDWLDNSTAYGFPRNKIKEGDFHYWFPRDRYVAGFDADSDWAWLYCGRDPSYSVASLGVFACAEGTCAAKNFSGENAK